MVLICISLMAGDVEHLFMCSFAMCICSSLKYLFIYFVHFSFPFFLSFSLSLSLSFFLPSFLYYFWLRWVFVATLRLSLVAVSWGYSLLRCSGFSLRWLLVVEYGL